MDKAKKEKVYKLKRELYGLKQAPRAWYNKIKAYFLQHGCERCFYEHTLFTKSKDSGRILIVSLYVNDLIYTKNDDIRCDGFKTSMILEFDVTNLEKMKYFFGVEILQNAHVIFVSKEIC